ncbi:ABC transporter substrate-binding protein [Phycicoccus jejuensis]|uniref:ABC transporter substrate-binding protein n=1 Tax=Phycicoccus jejuensis TaxID=367299 RepID=UPI0038510866
MRIVSLIPSATEILFALGAGDDVVGVTFECDFPPEARTRRVVSTSALPEGLAPGEIDVSTVDAALRHLGCRAAVLTVDPHTLEEVLASVGAVGAAVGRETEAAALVASLRQRLDAVRTHVAGRRRPRVAVLEWTDPPFAPGHWIPEMVQLAGGECVLGAAGERSVAIGWEDLAASRPEVVVVAPCGYDREGAQRQADVLVAARVLPDGVVVHAVDADGLWARPGPRLVDGVEELAGLLHPRG